MKNFYEATVTKPNLKLSCCLSLKVIHDPVLCIVKINGQTMFEDDASGQTRLVAEHHLGFQLPLTEPINISIQLINRQHPDAVEVALEIDEHKLLPLYQQSLGVNSCYIDSNNVWSLTIENFYKAYHTITGQGWII